MRESRAVRYRQRPRAERRAVVAPALLRMLALVRALRRAGTRRPERR